MSRIGNLTLIARAALALRPLEFVDAKVISTDSREYAREGERYGLLAPFLRPPELSSDSASAVDTLRHALLESERALSTSFDMVLVIEPTSPLRQPADVERAAHLLLKEQADSVVSVSPSPTKFHPQKQLAVVNGRLSYHSPEGANVSNRQQIEETLYWRNGVCYALTRGCLMERGAILTENSVADIITRPVVNVDEPGELAWAEFLVDSHEKGVDPA